jgi:hypothetical protein
MLRSDMDRLNTLGNTLPSAGIDISALNTEYVTDSMTL